MRSKIAVMNTRRMDTRHWWNGRWSRLTRREIYVFGDGGQWRVELIRGGEGGRSRTRAFGTEGDAVAWVEEALLKVDDGWREVLTQRARLRAV